jgi:protein-S-isoprenylcysteine O-methyltransferase Ste14
LLESWIGLTVAILPSLGLIVRTAMEDRELRLRLDGYLEYAGRVRHRLIPLIW